jgi:hypothetical protein
MGKPLDVPWDRIREACEKGTPLAEVSRLFGIKNAAIRMRSCRESWNTPARLARKLNKATGMQGDRVARNLSIIDQLQDADVDKKIQGNKELSLIDQLNESGLVKKQQPTSTDLESLSKNYREKAADKFYKLFTQTVIAPPRNWKDMKILDDLTRRALGLEDGEGKSNTIVQLQVVNDRLRASVDADIVEGELVAESVPKVSHADDDQREMTGCIPAEPSILTPTPLPSDKDAGCQD